MSENFENLLEFYRRQLALEYAKEYQHLMDRMREDLKPKPGWKGFTGILGVADEWTDLGQSWNVWHHLERPKTFTPAEFNNLWNSFSKTRKIEYVLSLIT